MRALRLILAAIVTWTVAVSGRQSQSPHAPLAFFPSPDGIFLARLDPIKLEPTGPRVAIGEYHMHALLSADGSRLAVATGGPGGGMQIVDVERMERLHSIRTGIATEALAWLTPTRVAGALQCNPANSRGQGCAVLIVDLDSGTIVKRFPEEEDDGRFLPFRPPLTRRSPGSSTRHGAVFLLGHLSKITAGRLVRVGQNETFQWVSLPPIQIGLHATSTTAQGMSDGPDVTAGLAIDHTGGRAFVVGSEPTVAEIDLATMDVRYHEVAGLPRRGDLGVRQAIWLPGAGIVVYGLDITASREGASATEPAGVHVIDPATWRLRTMDRRASAAVAVADSLLVYGGRRLGLTSYGADGGERFTVLADEQVREVFPDGRHAYVLSRQTLGQSPQRVSLIDASTGAVLQARPDARLVDLVPQERPRF